MTETDEIETLDSRYETLIGLLEKHDWNYIDAPSLDGFRQGSRERSDIELLIRTLATPEAKFIYTAYKTAYTRH